MIHRASRVLGLLASLAVLLHAPVAAQCIGGGVGGPIPATGTGNATWPAALPVAPLSSTLAVTVPSGATCLKSVKLQGLTHTWSGDVQFVLEDPAGGLHNLLCGMPSNPLEDFGGDYELVDPVQAVLGLTTVFSYSSNGNPIASGTYAQNFGGHIPGNHGIQNTPLEQIPIASGLWTLHAYDWFSGDSGALTSWELCFGTPTPPPPPPPPTSYTCLAAAAPAGVFPSSGGADGAWPLTLPMGELISSATVIPPAGATLAAVKLIGFQHTWSSDAMIVLESPNGQRHILWQRDNGSNCNGCGDDFNGDYVFVSDPLAPQIPSCGVGSYPSGTYRQDTGGWNSGDALLLTTPIAQIPVSAGVWKLTCYDWCVAYDDGYLSAWELCFNAPATPQSYCTAGTSTNGCTATISANANPTVSRSAPCNLTVTNIEGQKSALVFYSVSGAQAVQWNTRSLLCVKAPTQRTTVQNSGGSIAGCNGSIQLDWNAFQAANPGALGAPWSVGDKVWLQAWHRDPPAGKSTNLSNALEMTYLP
jgi:subtilisin-like proprotein convertase family protein